MCHLGRFFRGVFKTHSNIWDEVFLKNSYQLKAVNCFRKKVRLNVWLGYECPSKNRIRNFWSPWKQQNHLDQTKHLVPEPTYRLNLMWEINVFLNQAKFFNNGYAKGHYRKFFFKKNLFNTSFQEFVLNFDNVI